MNMKLWVDDIRNAPDESWTVARTALAAIRGIARYEFKEISLDHDISHQVTIGNLGRPYPCEETFMSVVYYIALKYDDWDEDMIPKITLHTSNTVAADEMTAVLAEKNIHCVKKLSGLANRLEMEI